MTNLIDQIDAASLRDDVPAFRAGDTLRVHVRVVEGSRTRTQVFQGVVIARQGGGVRETFTIRKISFGVGVERTFPVHTPSLRGSRSSPAAMCVARSCTICATCVVRPPRSRSVARAEPPGSFALRPGDARCPLVRASPPYLQEATASPAPPGTGAR